jgi:hypothetical protein
LSHHIAFTFFQPVRFASISNNVIDFIGHNKKKKEKKAGYHI